MFIIEELIVTAVAELGCTKLVREGNEAKARRPNDRARGKTGSPVVSRVSIFPLSPLYA